MTTVPARPGETILRTISLALLEEIATGGLTIQTVGVIVAYPQSTPAGTSPTFNGPAAPAIVNASTAVSFWITTDPDTVANFIIEVPCTLSDGNTVVKGEGMLQINRG